MTMNVRWMCGISLKERPAQNCEEEYAEAHNEMVQTEVTHVERMGEAIV